MQTGIFFLMSISYNYHCIDISVKIVTVDSVGHEVVNMKFFDK